MENRVAKHYRLEIKINLVCTYWGLHLLVGPASQDIFEGA